jgi:hypothetical protein
VIAYYESEGAQPPGALLVDLAKALEVTTDGLLDVEPLRNLCTGTSWGAILRSCG